MRNYKIIGLTGPTGAGKSTVANVMNEMGCAVIDADRLSREAVKPGASCTQQLCSVFGQDIKMPDGSINRSLLAQRAFSSKEKTQLLNSIVHPWVFLRTFELINEYKQAGIRVIVFDAPLLFESNADAVCDEIICVTAPREVRLKRILNRDSITEEQAELRLSAQHDDAYYTGRCDQVIDGSLSMEEVRSAARRITQAYR